MRPTREAGSCCKDADERHLVALMMTSHMSSSSCATPSGCQDDVIGIGVQNDDDSGRDATTDVAVDYTTVPLYRAMRPMFVSMHLC